LDGQKRLKKLRLPLVELRAVLLISRQHVVLLINLQRLRQLVVLLTNLQLVEPPAVPGTNNCPIDSGIPGRSHLPGIFHGNNSQSDFDR
jgi:hypothetical protein